MKTITFYVPSSKLALRDLKYINFFKKLSNEFKINLFIDYKLKINREEKKYFKSIVKIKKFNKIEYLLWSTSHQLARLIHEKKIFPYKIEKQTLTLGKKHIFLIEFILFCRLENLIIKLFQRIFFF